jgi:uncharacterized protein
MNEISPAISLANGPVAPAERIASIDVLRGLALLGILVINIDFFALPMAIFSNPTVAGGFTGFDLLTWKFDYLFFLEKMMAIFSMLFGAGLILMYNRADKTQGKFAGTYYLRILWLALFGLIHAYLFWYGDILFSYALCGLLLYPFRRRSPRLLIILAVVVLMIGGLMSFGAGISFSMLKNQAIAVEEAEAAGEKVEPYQIAMRDQWYGIRDGFMASPQSVAAEIEAYRGSLHEVSDFRIGQSLMMQTQGFFFRVFWRVLALMLLGMALMKLGMFSGERSPRFYILCIVIGYGIGLPVCGYGMGTLIGHNFDFIHFFKTGSLFNYFGSVLVSLGHIGVLMLIYKSGLLSWLTGRLAAVGRMAFSNYFLHTLICTTLFYGYGFGLFGHINRFGLFGIVVAIWILQLYISPLWLKHFRFGPAEWLWRSLTYRKLQPMRVKETV